MKFHLNASGRSSFPVAGAVSASALLLAVITAGRVVSAPNASAPHAPAAAIHLEAEDALLQGPRVAATRAGYQGRGYVTGFEKDGSRIVWDIADAKAGIYEARVRYSSPRLEKGYELGVNESKSSNTFAPTGEEFAVAAAGKVELRDGRNTVSIERGWGYYDIDALDLAPAKVDAALKPLSRRPTDPQATREARALMSFLVDSYGVKTLSGQHEEKDTAYIRSVTGKTPAIRGGDLMEYSPSRVEFGAKPEGIAEKLIQHARDGQIVTLSWHWNAPSGLYDKTYVNAEGKSIEAPWWRGFYTDASTFDVQKALDDPDSNDYKLLLRDIDAIAVQLKKFSEARVPLLWRPLHEAEGGWFWWGARGPDAFKKLWRLTFDRLTQTHGLHNLIWVYTAGNKPDWYPGDEYVDIVGADSYPSDAGDPLSAIWEDLKARFDGRKLIALTEFGKVPDIEKMRRFGARWSYFTSWTGDLGPQAMPGDALQRIYSGESVMNRDDLRTAPWVAARLVPVVAPAEVPATAPPVAALAAPPIAADYRRLADETTQSLQRDVLSQWFPRAVNTTRGGFDQNYATDWSRNAGDERSIVYQSRLTWLAAQAARRFPAQAKEYREYSRHGLNFLGDRMWDKQYGGFYWELNDAGAPLRGGEKHAYGIAFAIYAACANYQATRDPRALELAKRAFSWLDAHAHDAKNGGYHEALRRDGKPMTQVPAAPAEPNDFIGTRYGFKSMNTHIHLLEAFSELLRVWPTKRVRSRTREVFFLVRDKITVPSVGAMNLFFTPDWRAVPDHDSYGHDIETAYLLMEAAHVLKRADAATWKVARRLVDHTLEFGFDTENGGFYDTGGTFGGVTKDDKVWWVQAEGLNALLLMHERFGRQTPRYWNAFVQQWNFIRAHQIDVQNGGWRQSVSRTGEAVPGQNKSDRWTEGYHQGRALLNVSALLSRLADEAGSG